MTAIDVVRAGPFTTVQDLGRPGLAHLGVPRSGAADAVSHRRANDAVGNAPDLATLETTLGGCTLRVRGEAVVAVAGATCEVFVGGVRAPFGAPVRLRAGQVLEVGPASRGLRSYVAIRGGVDAPAVLGSRATDVLSGLGPAPLRDGDVVPVGDAAPAHEALFGRLGVTPRDHERVDHTTDADGATVLYVRLGPREDWCAPAALDALATQAFEASAESNRIGLRLSGTALARSRTEELASEPMVLGAVQVPPSGQPVVFLADHPTTGGYPVIGVVENVHDAAQVAPGGVVRFVTV